MYIKWNVYLLGKESIALKYKLGFSHKQDVLSHRNIFSPTSLEMNRNNENFTNFFCNKQTSRKILLPQIPIDQLEPSCSQSGFAQLAESSGESCLRNRSFSFILFMITLVYL